MMEAEISRDYLDAYRGRFTSAMRWPQLDDFWSNLKSQAKDDWYIYAVGENPPEKTASREQFRQFISKIDTLLHEEHDEDFCGIVYFDDKDNPSYVKIFDPNNLGVSCGYSERPPLPGWILSKIRPVELEEALYPPNSRRRWWQKIFD